MNRAVIAWTLAFSIVLLGLVLIGLSIPTALGKVAPNQTYGFRTAKTMRDPALWYRANMVASRITIGFGVLMLALAPMLIRISRNPELTPAKISYIGMAFEVVPAVVLVVVLLIYNAML